MLLDPLDLYGIANALTEEERMVQNVARLVSEKVLSTIHKAYNPLVAIQMALSGQLYAESG